MKEWGEAEVIDIGYGLSLVPRVKIKLSFRRPDMSVKVVDEWQLKECVKALIHRRLHLDVAERDLVLVRDREPQKRRRDEPVAWGVLHIWDIVTAQTTAKLNDSELNVGGIKLKCEALVDDQDSFESMQKTFGTAFSGVGEDKRGTQPDTLILRGIPSRWLSEPQVSFKASTLVTHTILSTFGKIRNLEVVVDGDLKKVAKGGLANIATALHCDIYVQYETSSGFHSALRAFCGRSMKKDISSCNVDYVVCWDRDSYFSEKNIRKRRFEKGQQALIERNQLAHQAELVRIEKGKKEAEMAKQLLWEEDQKKRKKEEALREETRIRMEQERELKKKEEELHEKKEEELRAAEMKMRMEQEKLLQRQKEEEELRAEELRMRLEKERILQQQKEEELVKERQFRREDNHAQHVAQEKQKEKQNLEQSLRRRLQAQQDIIRLESLQKKLEDEWGRRREDKGNTPKEKNEEFPMQRQENLMDDRWPLNVRNVTQDQYDQENPMDDRWQLDATETPASSWAAEILSQTTGRGVCHSLLNEEDSSMQHSVKRLRSIIIGTSMK